MDAFLRYAKNTLETSENWLERFCLLSSIENLYKLGKLNTEDFNAIYGKYGPDRGDIKNVYRNT